MRGYLVIDYADVESANLTDEESNLLASLLRKVDLAREVKGKEPLRALVTEYDSLERSGPLDLLGNVNYVKA